MARPRGSRRAARRGRDRHLPGHHARRRAARLRGLRRDGGGADRDDPGRVRRSATGLEAAAAEHRVGTRAARRAERHRRRLGRPPRRGLRGRPRGDRPDQGRGADLEARGRGGGEARWVEGDRAAATQDERVSEPLTHLDDDRQRPDGRRRRQDRDRAPRAGPRRGCGCRRRRRPRSRAATRRRARCSAPRGSPGIQARQADRRADPARPPAAARLRRRRGAVDVEAGAGRARRPRPRTVGRTGVEMEAMTACAVAALTVYDMVKGLERGRRDRAVVLLEKSGGRSGDWRLGRAASRGERARRPSITVSTSKARGRGRGRERRRRSPRSPSGSAPRSSGAR